MPQPRLSDGIPCVRVHLTDSLRLEEMDLADEISFISSAAFFTRLVFLFSLSYTMCSLRIHRFRPLVCLLVAQSRFTALQQSPWTLGKFLSIEQLALSALNQASAVYYPIEKRMLCLHACLKLWNANGSLGERCLKDDWRWLSSKLIGLVGEWDAL